MSDSKVFCLNMPESGFRISLYLIEKKPLRLKQSLGA